MDNTPINALTVFVGLFSSRKNQIMAGTAISMILAAIGFRNYPPEVIAVIIAGLVTLGSMVINGIKAEDVAKHTADGVVAAANVTAAASAQTTTVTTPSGNVEVKTSDTATPDATPAYSPSVIAAGHELIPPSQPFVNRTGG